MRCTIQEPQRAVTGPPATLLFVAPNNSDIIENRVVALGVRREGERGEERDKGREGEKERGRERGEEREKGREGGRGRKKRRKRERKEG